MPTVLRLDGAVELGDKLSKNKYHKKELRSILFRKN